MLRMPWTEHVSNKEEIKNYKEIVTNNQKESIKFMEIMKKDFNNHRAY